MKNLKLLTLTDWLQPASPLRTLLPNSWADPPWGSVRRIRDAVDTSIAHYRLTRKP